MRSSDHETACGIDEKLRILIHHVGRDHRFKHIFADILMNLLLGYLFAVLCGKHHCIQTAGLSVLVVLYRHLRFSIGTQVGQRAVLADLRELAHQLMCQRNGIGHILRRLIRSITEHHTLVPGSDRLDLVLRHQMLLGLQRFVYAHGNIRRLLVNGRDNRAVICVKAIFPAVISDFSDRITDNLLNVHIALRRNLAHYQHHAGGRGSLTGYAAHGVLLQQSVQNRVGNLVADFVRMAFGNRFRCK